jgi:acetyltransferase-like isoleucine patch superfamily enzyme
MKRFEVHKTAIVEEGAIINCTEEFVLGPNCIIKSGCKITCTSFIADEGLYMCEGVEVGRGGCFNPESKVRIGKNVGIFENAIINPNSEVTIGDNCGIGAEVMIWTHGAWLDITQGFPADFGPVTIGNNVWLPARSIVLPNTTIGDNCVIGIGSTVTKDIPAGSMAAGTPCKVIRENFYPKKLDTFELEKLINPILDYWFDVLVPQKGIETVDFLKYNVSTEKIELTQGDDITYYDVRDKTIEGYENVVSEDLRDFLRRRGIKIFTGKPFKSI